MTPERVELGRFLFYEPALSGPGNQSCGSCHRQALAFTDGRPTALGATGLSHPRSALGLTNVAYRRVLGWAEPQLRALEDQVRVPLLNEHPVEMGMAGREEEILARLEAEPDYRNRFARAFPEDPDPIRLESVARAISSFERTLISGRSPYDRLVFDDDRNALSPAAMRGMRLFFSHPIGCSGCHGGLHFAEPAPEAPAAERSATIAAPPIDRAIARLFQNTALYDLDGRGAYPAPNEGLMRATGQARDMGRFRIPTLRNVAVTAPFMHDGSIARLDDVIRHYAAGGRAGTSPLKSPRLRGFEIDERGVEDLVAFLESLTDPGFLTDPRFGDPRREAAGMP